MIRFVFLLIVFIGHNVNGSGLISLEEKQEINPGTCIFTKDAKFVSQDDINLYLKAESSKPVIKSVPIINLGQQQTAPQTVNILKKNSTVFHIFSNGTHVGYIKSDIEPNNPRSVYIRKIEIFEQNRKKGIGTRALPLVLQAFQNFKINSFTALIQTNNLASQKIFEKNGFRTDKSTFFNMYRYTYYTNYYNL